MQTLLCESLPLLPLLTDTTPGRTHQTYFHVPFVRGIKSNGASAVHVARVGHTLVGRLSFLLFGFHFIDDMQQGKRLRNEKGTLYFMTYVDRNLRPRLTRWQLTHHYGSASINGVRLWVASVTRPVTVNVQSPRSNAMSNRELWGFTHSFTSRLLCAYSYWSNDVSPPVHTLCLYLCHRGARSKVRHAGPSSCRMKPEGRNAYLRASQFKLGDLHTWGVFTYCEK